MFMFIFVFFSSVNISMAWTPDYKKNLEDKVKEIEYKKQERISLTAEDRETLQEYKEFQEFLNRPKYNYEEILKDYPEVLERMKNGPYTTVKDLQKQLEEYRKKRNKTLRTNSNFGTGCRYKSPNPTCHKHRINAREYALKWVSNYEALRNPKYMSYRFDCTNFISQILEAGGRQYIENFDNASVDSLFNWFHKKSWFSSPSRTRRFVDDLRIHFLFYPGLFKKVANLEDLEVGDILFADRDNDGDWDHSMVITEKNSNNPFDILLSYHSTDTKNLMFNDFLGRLDMD